jgi:hypothetical protein
MFELSYSVSNIEWWLYKQSSQNFCCEIFFVVAVPDVLNIISLWFGLKMHQCIPYIYTESSSSWANKFHRSIFLLHRGVIFWGIFWWIHLCLIYNQVDGNSITLDLSCALLSPRHVTKSASCLHLRSCLVCKKASFWEIVHSEGHAGGL